jgi:nicotinate-nucleotide adenylyltransferase
VRLGVFGGTFDPPHIGHLVAAQDALTSLALDRVVLVPAAVPPHKLDRTITPGRIRLELLRAAVAGDARFEVDDLELRREGPSWTVDTLRALGAARPDAELFLLMGADQYAELDTWREPDEIRRLARIAVLARAGTEVPAGADRAAVNVTRIDITSTEIRRRVAAGLPIRFLVPAPVEALIARHGLYGAAAPGPAPGSGGRIGVGESVTG